MSYFRRARALSGVSTTFPAYRKPRVPFGALGTLGDDTTSTLTGPPTAAGVAGTLAQPTLMQSIGADPATLQWQTNVLAQLQVGVATLQKAELQKWLQIAATVSIPLFTAIWKIIFKKGAANIGTGF
jgi:hypothetical protein